MIRLIVLIACLSVLACGSNAPRSTPTTPVPDREPTNEGEARDRLEIPLGRSVHLDTAHLTIQFESVPEDSRCPLDVVCAWAGNGAVRLNLVSGAGSSTPSTLNTTLEPQSVVSQGVSIRLLELKPYPVHPGPHDPAAYIAVLQVTPR